MAYSDANGVKLWCSICDSLLERRDDRSWACVEQECPQGIINWARKTGVPRSAAIQQFRLGRRSRRGLERARFDDEVARDLCAAAARAWPPAEHEPSPILADEIAVALGGVSANEGDIANARNWLELVTVGEPPRTILDTLWRGYNFGEALPCPLQSEQDECTEECVACYGSHLLLQDCDHCTAYIQIIPAALVDGV